jgi:hypothetical protein
MANRIKMGYHSGLNDYGMFISKPGYDVNNTGTNFLLDSRYRTLSIHAFGKVAMSRSQGVGGNTIWWQEITFPDLGYRPVFFGNINLDTSNSLGIPVNAAGFPISACSTYGRTNQGAYYITNSVWLLNNTTLRARCAINVSEYNGGHTLRWIIFKNRFE